MEEEIFNSLIELTINATDNELLADAEFEKISGDYYEAAYSLKDSLDNEQLIDAYCAAREAREVYYRKHMCKNLLKYYSAFLKLSDII